MAGSLGSGRWKKLGRKTVDSCLALDVGYLSAKGWLQPGRSSVYPCSLGSGPNSEVILICLRAEIDHLYLSWRRFANTGNNAGNNRSSIGSSIGASGGSSGEQEGAIVIPIARVPRLAERKLAERKLAERSLADG